MLIEKRLLTFKRPYLNFKFNTISLVSQNTVTPSLDKEKLNKTPQRQYDH